MFLSKQDGALYFEFPKNDVSKNWKVRKLLKCIDYNN